jgi:hypothetical protein
VKIKLVKSPYSVDEAKMKAEENVHKKGEEKGKEKLRGKRAFKEGDNCQHNQSFHF